MNKKKFLTIWVLYSKTCDEKISALAMLDHRDLPGFNTLQEIRERVFVSV